VDQNRTSAVSLIPFERFSPNEMHGLLYSPFDAERSPMVLNLTLDASRYREAPITESIRRYLEVLHEAQPVKLTARGYIPPAVVRQLWDAGVVVERGGWFHDHAPSKELDCDYLGLLRFLCDGVGLTKKRHGELSLTKKAVPLLDPSRAGQLFAQLLEFYSVKLAWDSVDGYPASWIVQAGFGYSLYLAQRHGTIARNSAFYAGRFRSAFPPVMQDFADASFMTADQQYHNAYHIRVLDRFMRRFGLVTLAPESPAFGADEANVTATPLLIDLVSWQ
jgi:hypothetical protein